MPATRHSPSAGHRLRVTLVRVEPTRQPVGATCRMSGERASPDDGTHAPATTLGDPRLTTLPVIRLAGRGAVGSPRGRGARVAVRAGLPHLMHSQRRLLPGAGARALGRGGGARMARISGVSCPTVYTRWHELDEPCDPRAGCGVLGVAQTAPEHRPGGLVEALEALVDFATRRIRSRCCAGCASTRELADALTAQGHPAGGPGSPRPSAACARAQPGPLCHAPGMRCGIRWRSAATLRK
jgi:hypothetical protein